MTAAIQPAGSAADAAFMPRLYRAKQMALIDRVWRQGPLRDRSVVRHISNSRPSDTDASRTESLIAFARIGQERPTSSCCHEPSVLLRRTQGPQHDRECHSV